MFHGENINPQQTTNIEQKKNKLKPKFKINVTFA